MKRALLFLLLSAVFLRVGAQLPTEMNFVLASVNGEAITLGDVVRESRRQEERLPQKDMETAVWTLRRQILDEQIDRKLILQAYQAAPFEIPVQYVESLLDQVATDSGVRSRSELDTRLRQGGTSMEELRARALETIIQQSMLARQARLDVNVTPRELFDYYSAHPEEFMRPERMRLALFLLKPDAPEPVRRAADGLKEHPARFAELARLYSAGPAREKGGDIGEIVRGQLRSEFATALTEPVAGRVYGPVATPEGVYYLHLTAYSPRFLPEFRDIAADLRDKTEAQKRKESKDAYIKKLREQAVVRYFLRNSDPEKPSE